MYISVQSVTYIYRLQFRHGFPETMYELSISVYQMHIILLVLCICHYAARREAI